MENIVNDVPPEPVKPVEVKADIDPNIIQKAIDDALLKSEMARQERKRIKKANLDEQVRKAKAEEEIKKMVYPPQKIYYGDPGFYSKNLFKKNLKWFKQII